MTHSAHDNSAHGNSSRGSRHDEKTDQDLLLLAHGALPLWPRLRVQLHLRRCPRCRTRLTALTQASSILASAVRGPGLPAWSRADAVSRALLPRKRFPQLALVLALGVALTLCLIAWTALAPALHPAVPAAAGGCRPDLPNSRCR